METNTYLLVADALQQCNDATRLFVEFHTLGPMAVAEMYGLLREGTVEEFTAQFCEYWYEANGWHF